MSFENPNRGEIAEILKTKKRIAVVGLSDNPMRTSHSVSEAMKEAGYEIVPVNPNVDSVFGIKAVPALSEVEGHVDIVNVFRRSEFLPELAKETAAIGADVFWAQLGVYHDEAYEQLKAHNITVIMDRCIKVEHAMMKQ
ncbi:CoA-binding protein [Bacillus marinisedimentorum]|uniref:CoA-binding protein n=1 Tax=Bacillus marinisedimentorum TaxID=1821260 RepID=UPI0007E144B4|nr:CoA-binding protein [Bacillus marinisedimentorum]